MVLKNQSGHLDSKLPKANREVDSDLTSGPARAARWPMMRPSLPQTRLCAALAIAILGYPASVAQAQSRTNAGNPLDQLPKMQLPSGGSVTLEPSGPAPQSDQAARVVTAARFQVEGVHSIPFAAVQAVFAPFAGHPIKVEELTVAAKQVSAM